MTSINQDAIEYLNDNLAMLYDRCSKFQKQFKDLVELTIEDLEEETEIVNTVIKVLGECVSSFDSDFKRVKILQLGEVIFSN
jgi:flagellin-specific chaperone FliS